MTPITDWLDEILLSVASWLSAADLTAFQSTCKRLAALPTDVACWRRLCEAAWQDKPRYRLTPERERWLQLNLPLQSWRARYIFFEQDSKRQLITDTELISLNWYFNYSPQAGGVGKRTLQRVEFTETHLRMQNYPLLPWRLEPSELPAQSNRTPVAPEGRLGRFGPLTMIQNLMQALLSASPLPPKEQVLLIANFPPHRVQRKPDDWEWLIQNDNVIFVSALDESCITYNERGFLESPQHAVEAHD